MWASTLAASPIYVNSRVLRVKKEFAWRMINEECNVVVERIRDNELYRVDDPVAAMILVEATKHEGCTVKELVYNHVYTRLVETSDRREAEGKTPPFPQEYYEDNDKTAILIELIFWLTAYLSQQGLISFTN